MGKLKYILINNVTGSIKKILSLEYNEKDCMETIISLI